MQLTGLEGVPHPQHKFYIELKAGPHKLRSRKLQPGSVKWDDAVNPHEFVFPLKTDSAEVKTIIGDGGRLRRGRDWVLGASSLPQGGQKTYLRHHHHKPWRMQDNTEDRIVSMTGLSLFLLCIELHGMLNAGDFFWNWFLCPSVLIQQGRALG